MRVTSSTYSNALIDHLNTLGLRQSRLQTQVSTGQRIQSPADDPVAMRRVMDMQAEAGSVACSDRKVCTTGTSWSRAPASAASPLVQK